MKITQLLFSPTGGTQKAADLLAHALSDSVQTVDLCDSQAHFSEVSLASDDLALIAVPSYGGRVPAAAIQRLAAVHGNGAPAILMVVYGNRAFEDTMVELEDAAKQAGFRIVAGVAAVAEHSIVREFAAGRPDVQDQDQLIAFAARIQEKLAAGHLTEPAIPGNRPYKKQAAPAWSRNPPKTVTAADFVPRAALYRPLTPTTLIKWTSISAFPACGVSQYAPGMPGN